MDPPADTHDASSVRAGARGLSFAPVTWDLPADPIILTDLRSELRALFETWAMPAEAGEDALLVISELIANVIDHAHTPFQLSVQPVRGGVAERTLQISVEDGCPRLPVQQPRDPYAARGRGLQIVDHLAARWGFRTHRDGKTVWADLEL